MNHLFKLLLPALFFISSASLKADEGMWLPQLLKALNEGQMQSLGMKISADDIYSVNHGSLKDAIVHFGGFCTSEVISGNGLLLTNHHCGYGQIQAHSTVGNNLLKNGYWAASHADELPNPGLTATFIDYIDDVSAKALNGVTESMSAQDRQSIIDKNIAEIRKEYDLESYQNLIIRPFFDGNQYFAFVTTVFSDVRLVGTPPESIGKFGSDTDNWEWPRHTGDFALFRIYADKDNKPADYSPDNVPYTPKHFLPISLDGVEEGDFTMIFGFPGKTNQYLPASAVDQIVKVLNPAKISLRVAALEIMDKYMRQDEATKIKYASKYASIANYRKKWYGEMTGLIRTNAVQKKLDYEKEFQSRLKPNSPYKNLISEMNNLYKEIEPYALVEDYYSETVLRNVELTSYLSTLRRLVSAYENGGESGYSGFLPRIVNYSERFYKNFDAGIDREKAARLVGMFVDNMDPKFVPNLIKRETIGLSENDTYERVFTLNYSASQFTDFDKAMAILNKSPEEAIEAIKSDPMYMLTDSWSSFHTENVSEPYHKIKREIDLLQAKYTKAQMEVFSEKTFYPDANSTMRVTYGQVRGYQPRDAVQYEPHTYLDGVIEKYVPGDYEFDVPERLVELYNKKDYGPYADKTGRVPVCFLGSNHTTGGNSGSPAIDAYGNLVGLNFDRVWEGTMSDINYDASICRNIMVDTRFVLWVIDKYAGAGHLIDEMKLVYPKTGK